MTSSVLSETASSEEKRSESAQPEDGAAVGSRAAKGAMMLVVSRLVSRLFDFGALLVLARLLTPQDFGLVAIAMSLMQVVEAVFELPVAQVVVRAHNPEPAMLDTAFTLSLLRGLVLAVVLGALSWPAALFFRQPALVPLICVLSLSPFMRGMMSPGLAYYSRALSFRQDVMIELSGKLAALISAVTAAIVLRNYWAIVAGTVTGPLVMMIVSYIIAPMAPRLSLARWREFMGILGWLSAAQIISAMNWQFDRLILSRYVSPASLGGFSMASDLANLPNQVLVVPMWRPLASAFSLIHRNGDNPRGKVLATCSILLALLLPVCLVLSLLAKPLVQVALGAKWAPSADYLGYLVLLIIPVFIGPVTSSLLMAQGRTRLNWWINFAEMVVKLPAAVILIWAWGLYGAIAARALAALLVFVFTVRILGVIARVSPWALWSHCWRQLCAGAVMATALVMLRPLIADAGPGLLQLGVLCLCLIAGISYGLVLLVLDYEPLRQMIGKAEEMVARQRV